MSFGEYLNKQHVNIKFTYEKEIDGKLYFLDVLIKNINSEKFKVIDARSRERFEGKVEEPRKGLRSGSIPKSMCIPFGELINDDNTFKNEDEILNIFKNTLGKENPETFLF